MQTSEIQDIIIDEEFRELLPPLDEKTRKTLEESIIASGCIFPLVIWQGILIDGHNRYAICTEHEIPFETVEKEFGSRDEVIIWIISNQVARRNLTPMQLSYFRGLHYNKIKGKRGRQAGENQYTLMNSENPSSSKRQVTAKHLSSQYKVSPDTIYTDAKVSVAIDNIGKASPLAKAQILSGDVKVEKKTLENMASAQDDEIEGLARSIEDGTYGQAKRKKTVIKPDTTTEDIISAQPEYLPQPQTAQPNVELVTGNAHTALVEALQNGETAQARKAIRDFIAILEEIYLKL